jgi:hypothetical protein
MQRDRGDNGAMADFLRFFLSTADQVRVAPASVTVTDLGQSLSAGPPQLCPIIPGAMLYRADPAPQAICRSQRLPTLRLQGILPGGPAER